MNIQVYAKTDDVLNEICRLFRQYDMYDHGYFTVYPALIDKVKAIDPEIELCTTHGWETRSNPETLKLCRETDGCRFVQPVREFTTEENYRYMRVPRKSNSIMSAPASIAFLIASAVFSGNSNEAPRCAVIMK